MKKWGLGSTPVRFFFPTGSSAGHGVEVLAGEMLQATPGQAVGNAVETLAGREMESFCSPSPLQQLLEE